MDAVLAELAKLVEQIGLPTLFGIVSIWTFIRLINVGLSDHANMVRQRDKEQADYRDLLKVHSELEKKFTICREELARCGGNQALIEHQLEDAVQSFMDETQDFDTEKRTLLKQIADLTKEVDNLKELLKAKE